MLNHCPTTSFALPVGCSRPQELLDDFLDDMADALGSALFVCADNYSLAHYGDKLLSSITVQANPAWGGYASCTDTSPGVCTPAAGLTVFPSLAGHRRTFQQPQIVISIRVVSSHQKSQTSLKINKHALKYTNIQTHIMKYDEFHFDTYTFNYFL